MNRFQIFLDMLQLALLCAEARKGGSKAADAYWRVVSIGLSGNTGFINGVSIPAAVSEYITHVYDGGKVPDFLLFAERGY